jgi:hypothetical protein
VPVGQNLRGFKFRIDGEVYTFYAPSRDIARIYATKWRIRRARRR